MQEALEQVVGGDGGRRVLAERREHGQALLRPLAPVGELVEVHVADGGAARLTERPAFGHEPEAGPLQFREWHVPRDPAGLHNGGQEAADPPEARRVPQALLRPAAVRLRRGHRPEEVEHGRGLRQQRLPQVRDHPLALPPCDGVQVRRKGLSGRRDVVHVRHKVVEAGLIDRVARGGRGPGQPRPDVALGNGVRPRQRPREGPVNPRERVQHQRHLVQALADQALLQRLLHRLLHRGAEPRLRAGDVLEAPRGEGARVGPGIVLVVDGLKLPQRHGVPGGGGEVPSVGDRAVLQVGPQQLLHVGVHCLGVTLQALQALVVAVLGLRDLQHLREVPQLLEGVPQDRGVGGRQRAVATPPVLLQLQLQFGERLLRHVVAEHGRGVVDGGGGPQPLQQRPGRRRRPVREEVQHHGAPARLLREVRQQQPEGRVGLGLRGQARRLDGQQLRDAPRPLRVELREEVRERRLRPLQVADAVREGARELRDPLAPPPHPLGVDHQQRPHAAAPPDRPHDGEAVGDVPLRPVGVPEARGVAQGERAVRARHRDVDRADAGRLGLRQAAGRDARQGGGGAARPRGDGADVLDAAVRDPLEVRAGQVVDQGGLARAGVAQHQDDVLALELFGSLLRIGNEGQQEPRVQGPQLRQQPRAAAVLGAGAPQQLQRGQPDDAVLGLQLLCQGAVQLRHLRVREEAGPGRGRLAVGEVGLQHDEAPLRAGGHGAGRKVEVGGDLVDLGPDHLPHT